MTKSFEISSPPWWTLQCSGDPVLATAIHDGGELGAEAASLIALGPAERRREEDPFTGQAILDVPTHLIVHRSRFEVDLNRSESESLYLAPQQSWGVQVWKRAPDRALKDASRRLHRAFYATLRQLLDELVQAHGCFALLDVHSYNHRRNGPTAPPMPAASAPDINIGTHSMPRERWSRFLEGLLQAMREYDFNGRRLDVRENIAFQGKGELARFVHENYPTTGCAVAIEFRKFYMDEWTGVADDRELAAMRAFVAHSAAAARELLVH
jgi:hypothetical protein